MQYELNKQIENARMINLAGRQRMISQRLAKIIIYAQHELSKNGAIGSESLDSLDELSQQWRNIHFALLKGSKELNITGSGSPVIVSLLQTNTPRLERIYGACQLLTQNPDEKTIKNALLIMSHDEQVYLLTAERIVMAYQSETADKLKRVKQTEFILSLISITLLVLQFALLFLPAFKRLNESSKKLTLLGNEFSDAKNDLRTSEEEIRSNLAHIHSLQQELEVREHQFHKIIEDVNDVLYELDEHGKFIYVNPVMIRLLEYSAEELLKKYYWDVVHPDHKERVIMFYKRQKKELRATSYLELSILTKTGKKIAVGQHVRMFFDDKWVTKVMVIARELTDLIQ